MQKRNSQNNHAQKKERMTSYLTAFQDIIQNIMLVQEKTSSNTKTDMLINESN